jgi:hypothetical protein
MSPWTSRTWPLDTIDPPSPLNDLAGKLPAHPPFSLPRWQLLFLSPRDLPRFLLLFLLLPWTKVVLWIFRLPSNLTPPSPASGATRWDTSQTSAQIPGHLPNQPQPGSRPPSRGIPCRSPAPPSNLLPLRQLGLRTTSWRTMTSPCGPPTRRAGFPLFLFVSWYPGRVYYIHLWSLSPRCFLYSCSVRAFLHGDYHPPHPTTCRSGTQSGILLRWLSPSLLWCPVRVFPTSLGIGSATSSTGRSGLQYPPLHRVDSFLFPLGVLRLLSPSVSFRESPPFASTSLLRG